MSGYRILLKVQAFWWIRFDCNQSVLQQIASNNWWKQNIHVITVYVHCSWIKVGNVQNRVHTSLAPNGSQSVFEQEPNPITTFWWISHESDKKSRWTKRKVNCLSECSKGWCILILLHTLKGMGLKLCILLCPRHVLKCVIQPVLR